MTIDLNKLVPYGLAGLVVALVATLVAIDVVASLPGSKGEVPAQTSPPGARQLVIETRREGPRHVVEAEVKGPGGKAVRLSLLIDTGATSIVLPYSMIPALGLRDSDLRPRRAQTAGGIVETRIGRLASVRVGPALERDVEVNFVDDATYGAGSTPLLGMSFLGRFRFTVDDAEARLILTPKQQTRETP